MTEEQIRLWDELADQAGREIMPPDMLDGFLSGLACLPHAVQPAAWMPMVFFEEENLPVLSDPALMPRLQDLMLAASLSNAASLSDGTFSPFFMLERDEQGHEQWQGEYWSQGFMGGLSLFRGELTHEMNQQLFELLIPIIALADPETTEQTTPPDKKHQFAERQEQFLDEATDAAYSVWHLLHHGPDPAGGHPAHPGCNCHEKH